MAARPAGLQRSVHIDSLLFLFSNLYPASLGMGVGVALVLLLYRACEKRIGTKQWMWMFGAVVYILWNRVWRSTSSYWGLLPFGFAQVPEAELLAARGGVSPLKIGLWVYLAGLLLFLLWQAVPYARFRLRVRRESYPADERVERAFEKVLQSVNADLTENWRGSVRVMPSLPGPMSVIYWPKVMLLDKEDYDDETLDAILRHELMHTWHVKIAANRSLQLLTAALHWFNPAVWWLVREERVREEFACDMAATGWRSLEKRQSYARAMVKLAAEPRREVPGTAHMACDAGMLRRRVEAVLRGEPDDSGFLGTLRRVGLAALAVILLVSSSSLFGLPNRFHITEENLLAYPGIYLRTLLGNRMDESAAVDQGDGCYLLNTGGRPYGAAAVLADDSGSIFLEFPTGMLEAEVEENLARLQERLTIALGEPMAAQETEAQADASGNLWSWFQRLWDAAEEKTGETLGVWQGETSSGTATVELALWPGQASHTPETEGGMLAGLLWDKDRG